MSSLHMPAAQRAWAVTLCLSVLVLTTVGASLASAQPTGNHKSLADHRLEWPTLQHVLRVASLQDYNTRIVLLGTVLLGTSTAAVGVFMLLRRRSLIGDVVSHSSLPGIAIAFLLLESIEPGSGRSFPALLAGAFVSGLIGVLLTYGILRFTRIKEDAALALVLSVLFGLGIALFTVVQDIPSGKAAGLSHFIFGKASSMVASDVRLIAAASLVILGILSLLLKEFSLLSFDSRFAAAQGWPVSVLDLTLMVLVTSVTVIALQSVGLLLAVALLIIPASAARFWTNRLPVMLLISSLIGASSAALGVFASALFPRLAAGAVIVLAGTTLFVISLLFGTRRGVLVRAWSHWQLRRNVGRYHILRAVFELLESRTPPREELNAALTEHTFAQSDLLPLRSWNPARVQSLVRQAEREGALVRVDEAQLRMTRQGALQAHKAVRNHRLWEIYLIEYADIAPTHVDRDADDIEHLLGPDVIDVLEAMLQERYPQRTVPPSPHDIHPRPQPGSGLT